MAMFPGVILFISWCSVSLDRNLIKYLVIHSRFEELQPVWFLKHTLPHLVFAKLVLNARVDLSGKKAKSEKTGFGDKEK